LKCVDPIQPLSVPKEVLDGSAADAHGARCSIQPLLHGIDHGFMRPTLDAALLAGRALGLERAGA